MRKSAGIGAMTGPFILALMLIVLGSVEVPVREVLVIGGMTAGIYGVVHLSAWWLWR